MVIIFLVSGIIRAAVGAEILTANKPRETADVGLDRNALSEPGTVPIGGPFELINGKGETVTNEDFGQKYLLVYFGYTYCPDVCPTTLADIDQTLDLLGGNADLVQPLFISVDPDRDTPKVVGEYVKAFDERIVGLTGTKQQIQKVAKEFRVTYNKVSSESYNSDQPSGEVPDKPLGDDYLVSHSGVTYLTSPDGEYITHFQYGTSPKEMAKAIEAAIDQFGRP